MTKLRLWLSSFLITTGVRIMPFGYPKHVMQDAIAGAVARMNATYSKIKEMENGEVGRN